MSTVFPRLVLSERWRTLDIIKACTVPAMIIVHNTIWWLSFHPAAIPAAMESWFLLTRALAYFVMLIPATAGAALFFYLGQHRGAALPPFSSVLLRALALSAVGFAMNVLAFGTDAALQWNVLQFFSLSMIVLYAVLQFSNVYVLTLLGVATLLTAPLLRDVFGTHTDSYVAAILIGEPYGTHLWPFFPWFAVVVTGFVVARVLHNKKTEIKKAIAILCSGCALIVLSGISGSLLFNIDFTNVWGSVIFEPPTMHIAGIIGVGLSLFGLVHLLLRHLTFSPYSIIRTLSAGLFYIYVLHMIVGHRLHSMFLQHSNDVSLMWGAIALQLVMAYLVGALVIYAKTNR